MFNKKVNRVKKILNNTAIYFIVALFLFSSLNLILNNHTCYSMNYDKTSLGFKIKTCCCNHSQSGISNKCCKNSSIILKTDNTYSKSVAPSVETHTLLLYVISNVICCNFSFFKNLVLTFHSPPLVEIKSYILFHSFRC